MKGKNMKILCDGHEYNVLPLGTSGQVQLKNNYGTVVAIASPNTMTGSLDLIDAQDGNEGMFKSYPAGNLPALADMPAIFVQEYISYNPNHNQ